MYSRRLKNAPFPFRSVLLVINGRKRMERDRTERLKNGKKNGTGWNDNKTERDGNGAFF